ncbi:helix-turn-helix domain-containing protein [Ochrobactrum teleogrylli]|uniref:Helix-turn-helix domain-containing protein n=1 Tax=Ochrobactrum teleogrylli TaxID=2479765 RepID=A0ABY2XYR6_9HYPH|nr:helix-turn-helix domain-containing protein [[Ochrobactrum] teleogrylli]TNV10077.1 helix-turn-helix domain-containing protein [[Ochrobactrum] teleogrylli]
MKTPQVKSIRALARGLDVMQLVQAAGAVSLNDLHRMSRLPKASLLRILKTLMEQGVIWQRIADGSYLASYSLSERAGQVSREMQLIEISSPILEALSDEVRWPSVLAVPRLTHMEVLETNAPRSYFHHIPLGPVGFEINFLRSATGRAFLAYCEDARREAILDMLRRSGRRGDHIAQDAALVTRMIEETRQRGYGLRDPDFGGHFDEGRLNSDDGRDSIAVAIQVERHVPGAINLTWAKKVLPRNVAAERYAERLTDAANEIAQALKRSFDVSPGETMRRD